ncbi:2298_t:CDS:2 [Gigaspora margarita]|uniref:2298_t:CDS:1 n=1 Tax=Gigaspora margarita TaxID=4874 RepID=A0ABN7VV45_GIGMA|nr:2298_t:CDS:2 [Gigaspora margarita]
MPAQTFYPNAIFHSLSSLNDLTLPPLRFLSSPSTDDEQGTLKMCLNSSPIQTTFDTLPLGEDTQYETTTPPRLLPLSQVSPLSSLVEAPQQTTINQQTVNENKENSVNEYKKFSCEECGKIYQGKNARSILRRHLKDKHEIELPRASRWDNDPNRPKNDEERRQRMLESKRKNLLKELEQKENKRVITHLQTNVNMEQNLNISMNQNSTPITPPSRIDRTVVLSPNSRMNPYVVMRPSKSITSPCKSVSVEILLNELEKVTDIIMEIKLASAQSIIGDGRMLEKNFCKQRDISI